MSTPGTRLGTCSHCESEVLAADALIEYERENGETAVYAACRECGAVGHPE